jgi:protein-S-isoprenylcysteine O-methyltransferase Ste14
MISAEDNLMSKPTFVYVVPATTIWRRLLLLDNNIFGLFVCATAVYDWWILYQGWDRVVLLYSHGIYALPSLSTLSIVGSAIYLSAGGVILLSLKQPMSRDERAAPNVLAVLAVISTYLFIWTPRGTLFGVNIYVAYLFILCGTAVMLASLVYLRRAFSVTPQARLLVTAGPYALIRHPMYAGSVLSLVGLALLIDSMEAIVLVFVCACLQFLRALLEEKILEATFPGYADYKNIVGRFFPMLLHPSGTKTGTWTVERPKCFFQIQK